MSPLIKNLDTRKASKYNDIPIGISKELSELFAGFLYWIKIIIEL